MPCTFAASFWSFLHDIFWNHWNFIRIPSFLLNSLIGAKEKDTDIKKFICTFSLSLKAAHQRLKNSKPWISNLDTQTKNHQSKATSREKAVTCWCKVLGKLSAKKSQSYSIWNCSSSILQYLELFIIHPTALGTVHRHTGCDGVKSSALGHSKQIREGIPHGINKRNAAMKIQWKGYQLNCQTNTSRQQESRQTAHRTVNPAAQRTAEPSGARS